MNNIPQETVTKAIIEAVPGNCGLVVSLLSKANDRGLDRLNPNIMEHGH